MFYLFVDIIENILLNISTDKAALSHVNDFLLAHEPVGSHQKLNLISECCSVPGKFENPTLQILNFQSQNVYKA